MAEGEGNSHPCLLSVLCCVAFQGMGKEAEPSAEHWPGTYGIFTPPSWGLDGTHRGETCILILTLCHSGPHGPKASQRPLRGLRASDHLLHMSIHLRFHLQHSHICGCLAQANLSSLSLI